MLQFAGYVQCASAPEVLGGEKVQPLEIGIIQPVPRGGPRRILRRQVRFFFFNDLY